MLDRFYHPGSLTAAHIELEGSEARHLVHTLRKKPGEIVSVFDGEGREATAEILANAKDCVQLKLFDLRAPIQNGRPHLALATAVPKGDRFRWLVEKATELGVDTLHLLRTERSIVHPAQGKMDKMRLTVIAACKQSGRNRLMQINPTVTWADLIQCHSGQQLLVADPLGQPLASVIGSLDSTLPVVMAVGPEGGLTDAERDAATARSARLVSLGGNILRVETAAIALVARLVLDRC